MSVSHLMRPAKSRKGEKLLRRVGKMELCCSLNIWATRLRYEVAAEQVQREGHGESVVSYNSEKYYMLGRSVRGEDRCVTLLHPMFCGI